MLNFIKIESLSLLTQHWYDNPKWEG